MRPRKSTFCALGVAAASALVAGPTAHAGAASHMPGAGPLTDVPAGAEPGDCFARVMIPAVYATRQQEVVTQEAFETLDVIAPRFVAESRRVQVRDEGYRYEVRQPRWETRTETVMTRPAHERLEVVPAQFETVTETVQVSPPRKVWKPGAGLSGITRTDPGTGTVYCLVEEPGETRQVRRRVMTQPESLRRVQVPAQYAEVTRKVLVDPGAVEKVPIPAEFRDIKTERLVASAGARARMSPAQTQSVDTRVLVQPERFEWVQVLCETNADATMISRVQRALAARGHYRGPIDGIFGPQTQTALTAFQAVEGIPHRGFLSVETLAHLGLADGSHIRQRPAPHAAKASAMHGPDTHSRAGKSASELRGGRVANIPARGPQQIVINLDGPAGAHPTHSAPAPRTRPGPAPSRASETRVLSWAGKTQR